MLQFSVLIQRSEFFNVVSKLLADLSGALASQLKSFTHMLALLQSEHLAEHRVDLVS